MTHNTTSNEKLVVWENRMWHTINFYGWVVMHANMLARNSIVCMCWAECGCCLVLVCIFWFMFIAQCSVDQCSVFSVCLSHVATLYRFVNDDFYVIQLRHFSYLLLICAIPFSLFAIVTAKQRVMV